MVAPVFKLQPGVQSYAWGKKGSASLAAQLGAQSIEDFNVDEDKRYAELWMGTHPNMPSRIPSESSALLSETLSSNQQLLGENIISNFSDSKDGSLPFLFKVLSIGTALSIQAHPDKKLAERLFKERPDVYKDNNHKPEMAIALTPFLAFLNFLPLPTILLHLLSVPELDDLVPSDLTDALATSLLLPSTRPADPFLFTPTVAAPTDSQKDVLKKIFDAFMSAPEDKVEPVIKRLVERYEQGEDVKENEKALVDVALTLNEQYPGDVGVLCVFLLNLVELKQGEAAFLAANMPHAYIKGDIIECMATSDNVVRAGLTPKLRDVPTLVEMLTYEAGPGSKQLLQPQPWSGAEASTNSSDSSSSDKGRSLLYDPPIDEFSVVRVDLPADGKEVHKPVKGPSVVIVTNGSGRVAWDATDEGAAQELGFTKGDVLFIGADTRVEWSGGEVNEKGQVELFRAFVEAA